jgi:hypothetical protein
VDELSLLFGISYTLESSLELKAVIRPVLLKMAEVLGMKRGTITILSRDRGEAIISEAVGLPAGREQASSINRRLKNWATAEDFCSISPTVMWFRP